MSNEEREMGEGGDPARVLIVDDEPNIVTSLRFLMEREGYMVEVAGDGRQALQTIRTFEPDLVLLDVAMPHLDGFAVAQRIRAESDRRVAVMMLTAKSQDAERAKGVALGADAYVTKPFSTRELVADVRRLLNRS